MTTDTEANDFHLSHAPIVETVIAIRFAERVPESALSGLKESARRIQDIYTIIFKEEIRSQQFQFTPGAAGLSNIGTPKSEGYLSD